MEPLFYLVLLLFVVIHLGYLISYASSLVWARVAAWALVLSSAALADRIAGESPDVVRMLAIISTTLFAMKSIVLVETYKGKPGLNYFQQLAFSAGWFGMRPTLFETLPSAPLGNIGRLVLKGISRIVIGMLLLFLSVKLFDQENFQYAVSSLLALVGMSFILHFGILNLSAASWRALGVDCRELFKSPGLSMSLNEFWGKRWNLAFSEMTARVIYRPLKDKLGKGTAVFGAFLFSGLLHELAISVPVRAGYGLPMLYFCLHGFLMLAEAKVVLVKKILLHKVAARIWVVTWLVLPMPLLFHKEFMGKIVFPLTNQAMTFLSLHTL